MKTPLIVIWSGACAVLLSTAAGFAAGAERSGIDRAYLDTSVAPGTDFFRYTNGAWLASAKIPADRQTAGASLELEQDNESKLKSIVAELIAKPDDALSAEQRKLRDLYSAFVDRAHIDALGLAPAQADLARINAAHTLEEVATLMGTVALPVGGPVDLDIAVDDKNPDAYIGELTQSGLGMPDRDYYLLTDHDSQSTRDAYRSYLTDMLAIAGVHEASRAQAVYALEERIAKAHWPAADRRDADKTYNAMSVEALRRLAPQFPWAAYFGGAGLSWRTAHGDRRVIVRENTAFPQLAKVFAETPVAVWRDYMTVRYLHARAAYLPQAVDDRDFAFYGKVIGGQQQQLPRELRGIHLLDREMGEALGQVYVARYFPPEAKAKIRQLVDNLLKAYAADIQTLAWMSPATRAKALEKVQRMTVKVGYPDHWRDYSSLEIVHGNLLADVTRAQVFEWQRQLTRIDGPVDRSEWDMTPPTVNAYNNPVLNEIVFPAGILQPPYFDANADDAANYGSIGAVIGHEISHGFDDQGSKYDASGRLNNWWTVDDRRNFDARTAALTHQYDAYEPLPGLHVNGKLTLGENIADLAGLVVAHKAYRLALHGATAPVLDGFTGDQRFYVAFGQSWREKWTDGLTRRVVLSNPHSPSIYRVDGVVRNDDGWYEAFPAVKSGDPYYLAPADRVRLW